jgi:hypothetical protein
MADPVRNHPAPVDEAALALSLRPFGFENFAFTG